MTSTESNNKLSQDITSASESFLSLHNFGKKSPEKIQRTRHQALKAIINIH